MTKFNSKWAGNCRLQIQGTRGFGYSYSSQSHWDRAYFLPNFFIERIFLDLESARIGMTLVSFYWSLSLHSVMTPTLLLPGLQNTCFVGPDEKVFYPYHTTRNYLDIRNPCGFTNHLVCKLVLSSDVLSEGSYVLSVFLLNTFLHLTQD